MTIRCIVRMKKCKQGTLDVRYITLKMIMMIQLLLTTLPNIYLNCIKVSKR